MHIYRLGDRSFTLETSISKSKLTTPLTNDPGLGRGGGVRRKNVKKGGALWKYTIHLFHGKEETHTYYLFN